MYRWKRYFCIFYSIILLIFLIAILVVSYIHIFYLILGFIVFKIRRRITQIILLLSKSLLELLFSQKTIILFLLVFIYFAFSRYFYSIKGSSNGNTFTIPINQYYTIIKPKTLEMNYFLIEHKFKIDKIWLKERYSEKKSFDFLKLESINIISLKEEMGGINEGLILKKLSIFPLTLNSDTVNQLYAQLDVREPFEFVSFYLKNDNCLKSTIKLVDFPKDSFYEAREPVNFKRSSYLNKDIFTWSNCDLESEINFTYLPPPYNNFTKLIKLIGWFHSAENYLFFFLGFGIAFTLSTKVKNLLHRLEIMVMPLLKQPSFYVQTYQNQGDTIMPEASKQQFNNDLPNAQFAGGLVNADTVSAHQIGGNITNYTQEQKQNLAQAAAEIQQLLFQLSQTNATTDEAVTEAIHQEIKRNPTLKARLQSALKAGGLEALKAIFNHPLFSISAETVKGWLEAE